MFPAKLRLAPGCRRLPRFALVLCSAGALLLPACCDMPMSDLLSHGPAAPGPLSSGMTPPLPLATAPWKDGTVTSVAKAPVLARAPNKTLVIRTSYHSGDADAIPGAREIAAGLDAILRLVRERNPRILQARERVNEAQAAFDAAVHSHLPEFLRKDTFKQAPAEALLWERRAELARTENEVLQDTANTYFDALAARRGEAVARELEKFNDKVLKRAQALFELEPPANVLVESAQTALNGRRQYITQAHQQAEAAVAKLAYLLGTHDGVPMPPDTTLAPIDLVDPTGPVEVLIQQSLDNGPGVRELQGLAAAIQTGLDDARCAQRVCEHTGAAGVCGRLHMAQSKLQQTHLTLIDTRGKLRAGVEEARSASLSGREQITQASSTIQHAAETYRLTNLRLEKQEPRDSMARNTYSSVLTSIQQLSLAHTSYLSAVNAYNKAQARLLLLLGQQSDGPPHPH
jgi:outer membrane protein TolC